MGLTILGALIGAIVAAGVAVFIEFLRKPELDILIVPPVDLTYQQGPATLQRSLRLNLINKALPWWESWMCRNAAQQCNGTITFHHLDGQNFLGRAMPIRWTGTPQPIPLVFQFQNQQAAIIDPDRIALQQRVDVYPGEAEQLDVACRFDNESGCYGWTNENFHSTPRWRNPNWSLPAGRYLVYVVIRSSGQKCSRVFRIINDVSQSDFRLEPSLPEDQDKVKLED